MPSRCLRGYAMVLAVLLSSGCALFPDRPLAPSSPYPPSSMIGSLTFEISSYFQAGNFPSPNGSDQWQMTWADDGNVYGIWGDGVGWNQTSAYASMGVTRILGGPPGLSGVDVWGASDQNWKPLAIVADAGHTIHIFWSTDVDNWAGSYGGTSTDNGITWNLNGGKVFDGSIDGVNVVGIAQFGPDYTNIPGTVDGTSFYVYLRGPHQTMWLGRVPKAQLFNRAAYTYFAGLDGSSNPIWTDTWSSRQPVFFDPAGMEYHVNVSYNPGIQRFIYAKGYNKSGLGVFEGPTPWGPWGTVYYGPFKDSFWKFTYQFPPKWMSADGLTMWMAWSGWPEYDNVNFIKTSLSLKSGSSRMTPR